MSHVEGIGFEARSVDIDRTVTYIEDEDLELDVFTVDVGGKVSYSMCEILISKNPLRTNDKEIRIYIPFDQVWKVIKKLEKARKNFQKRRPRYQVDY